MPKTAENQVADDVDQVDDQTADDAADQVDDATDDAGQDAADTVAGDAAGDTVAGNDNADAFAEFDDEAGEETADDLADQRTDRTGAGEDGASDDLAAIEAEADALDQSMDGGGKLSGLIKKLTGVTRKKDAEIIGLRKDVSTAKEHTAWNQFSERIGLTGAPQGLRQKLTNKAIKDRYKKHVQSARNSGHSEEYARGMAEVKLQQEVAQLISKAGGSTKRKRVATNGAGTRLTPPGGAGAGRVTKPKVSAEDRFDQGDYTY